MIFIMVGSFHLIDGLADGDTHAVFVIQGHELNGIVQNGFPFGQHCGGHIAFFDHFRMAVAVGNGFIGDGIGLDVIHLPGLTETVLQAAHGFLLMLFVEHSEDLEAFKAGSLSQFFKHGIDPQLKFFGFFFMATKYAVINSQF